MSHLLIRGVCRHIGRARVPGELTMVSVYNPPSAAIRAQITGGGGCLFITRLVNHKAHTFGELIEIQIVKCLSGCCKILLYPYFAILALDMASPIKILFKMTASYLTLFVINGNVAFNHMMQLQNFK